MFSIVDCLNCISICRICLVVLLYQVELYKARLWSLNFMNGGTKSYLMQVFKNIVSSSALINLLFSFSHDLTRVSTLRLYLDRI